MLISIKGVFENGQITLSELPKAQQKLNVIVTFMEDVIVERPKKRKAGVLSGKVWMADDFNAPLDDLKDYM